MRSPAPERSQSDIERGRRPIAPAGSSIGAVLARRRGLVLGLLGLVTAALAWPVVTTLPAGYASYIPSTEITRAQHLVDERLAPRVHTFTVVVEARDGNVLDRDVLLELAENADALRSDPSLAGTLEPVEIAGVEALGVVTIADAVEGLLRSQGLAGGLRSAGAQEASATASAIVDSTGPSGWGLTGAAERAPDGSWRSPVLLVDVAADNQALGGGTARLELGTDDDGREAFARAVQDRLRGAEHTYRAWVAGDPDLTASEQGEAAGRHVAGAVALVLIMVALVSRSYWTVAATGAASGGVVIWVLAAAQFAGVGRDQLVRVAAPLIALGFGASFLLHTLASAREADRHPPLTAFASGMTASAGSTAAGAAAGVAALLAGSVSDVEVVQRLGIVTATGVVAAWALLGIAAPLATATLEAMSGRRHLGRWGFGGDAIPIVAAVVAATAIALSLTSRSPAIGAVGLSFYMWLGVAAPAQRLGAARSRPPAATRAVRPAAPVAGSQRRSRPPAVIPLLVLLIGAGATGLAGWAAAGMEPGTDVTRFFADGSDIVAAADHAGDRPAEAVLVYVEGDFTSPASIARLRALVDGVGEREGGLLLRDEDGTLVVEGGVLDVIDDAVGRGSGDASSRGGVRAILEGSQTASAPGGRARVSAAPGGGQYATALGFFAADPSLTRLRATRELLVPLVEALAIDLGAADDEAVARLAGTAMVELERSEAMTRLAIGGAGVAIAAALLLMWLLHRSFGAALAGAATVAMVTTWYFGLAAWLEHRLGLVTAIVGVVTVGVATAFTCAFVARFGDERHTAADARDAIGRVMATTGRTILASAITFGAVFGVAALIPVPAITDLGLMGALAVGLSALGSLVVLPSLLVLGGGRTVVAPIIPRLLEQETPAPEAREERRRRTEDLVVRPAAPVRRPVVDIPPVPALADVIARSQSSRGTGWRDEGDAVPVEPVEPVEEFVEEEPASEPFTERHEDPDLVLSIAPDGSWVDIRLDQAGQSYVGRGDPTPHGIVEAMITVIAARDRIEAPTLVDVVVDRSTSPERITVVLEHVGGRRTSGTSPKEEALSAALTRAVTEAMRAPMRRPPS